MKYGVNKNILFFIAGTLWMVAGFNIMRIGISTWIVDSTSWILKFFESCTVFLFFFAFIFDRLYKKYSIRINNKNDGLHCPFSFFDKKGLLMMLFMIVMGISIRYFHLLPISFFFVLLFRVGIRFDADRFSFSLFQIEKKLKQTH